MIRHGRKISETSVQNYAAVIFPHDLNAEDMMFGGMVPSAMDRLGGSIFIRHTEGQSCATRHLGDIDLAIPVYKGDLLLLDASINHVWETSCEIGFRANIQRKTTGITHYLTNAYFTYVATQVTSEIDPETLHPKLKAVRIRYTVFPETKEEIRRYMEANARRNERLLKNPRRSL